MPCPFFRASLYTSGNRGLFQTTETDTATGEVNLLDNDGQPLVVSLVPDGNQGGTSVTGADSTTAFSIPSRSSLALMTDGEGDLALGSAVVTSDLVLGGNQLFRIAGVGIAGVAASQPLRGFTAAVRRETGGPNSGVALLNPMDQMLTVNLLLLVQGQEVEGGMMQILLPPGGKMARFIDEFFPDAQTDSFLGTILGQVEGEGAITATALKLGVNPGEFASLAVTPLP